MLFSVHFKIQGYRLHLALVEAIVVVVKATQILCALELPNSTLSCFPLASCNPRLAKVLLYFFQKWHSQWWRATKKSLCGLYFFSDRTVHPYKGGGGQGWPSQLHTQ